MTPKHAAWILCLVALVVGCGPVHPTVIPPRAILTATEEDALAQVPDPQVYVIGNVKLAGAYPFHNGMTVLQLLALSGGFGEWAKTGDITVARDVGGEWLGYHPFSYKRIVQHKPTQDFRLRPGDIVVVP